MENTQKFNDEIDLIALLDNFLKLLAKYVKPIAAIYTIFLAAGLFFAFTGKEPTKVYQKQMTIRSFVLSTQEITQVMQGLTTMVVEANTVQIAKSMNISQNDAKLLNSIVAEPIANKDSFIVVKAVLKENKSLENIQKGILYYISNTDYIKAHKKQQRVFLEQLEIEMKKLDSLKSVFATGKLTNTYFNPDIYRESLNLHSRYITLTDKLKEGGDTKVLTNFPETGEEITIGEKRSKKKVLILAVLGATALCVGLVAFLEVIRLLKLRRLAEK